MLRPGTKVRLKAYSENDMNFFDTSGYMWHLAFEGRTFIIDYVTPEGYYSLEPTYEHPGLDEYVWREEDLIPVFDMNDPNTVFLLNRVKYGKR